MPTPEDVALQVIDEQRKPILEKLEKAKHLVATLERSDAKLLAARLALTGEKSPRKRGRKTKASDGKTFACMEEIIAVCKAVLRETGPVEQAQLEAQVKSKLGQELGYSLNGVPRLLKQALAKEMFSIDADSKVSLVDQP